MGQHRHAGATAQPFSNQLSFLHCFKIKKKNNKKKIKNTQSSPNPFLPSGDPDPCRQVPAGSTPQHLVEQGAAEPKNTLFLHPIGDLVSSALGQLPRGGAQEPCPGRMERDGAGLGWLQGLLPCHIPTGSAGAALPFSRDRRQCRCPVHITPLAASHSPRARSELGARARLRREQDPGC